MDKIFLLAILFSFFCGLLVGSCAKRKDDEAAIAAAIRQGEQNGQSLSFRRIEALEGTIRTLKEQLAREKKRLLEAGLREKGYDRI